MNDAIEPRKPTILHPISGGLILGADWLLFGGTAATAGAALPLSMAGGFLTGLIGVTAVQHFKAGDGWGPSLLKGFLSGVVVGLPFPIGGTILGGAVLASSGLAEMRQRAARALLERDKGEKRD